MKNHVFLCMALAAAMIFAGCSGPEATTELTEQPNTDLPQPALEMVVAPQPEPAPEPEPAPAPEEEEVEAVEVSETSLVGSTWTVSGLTASFKDESTVLLKGGPLAGIAPDGLDATYKVEDGKFELNAMGMTRTGTFDGTTLIVDGTTAVRQ